MSDFIKATITAILIATIGLHLAYAAERRYYQADTYGYPSGFSSTPAVDIDDMGFKSLCRMILKVITEMHKTQMEILKHEEKIDANLQKLADKLAK